MKRSFSGEYSYVREIWIGVREKSGKCQGILFCPVCMNPAFANSLDPGQYQQISYIHYFYQNLSIKFEYEFCLMKINKMAAKMAAAFWWTLKLFITKFLSNFIYRMHYFYQSGAH